LSAYHASYETGANTWGLDADDRGPRSDGGGLTARTG
jgi:hypothetical protein